MGRKNMTTKARAANSKIRRRSPSATGVDTADHSKSIDKIDIEMTAWGAPRYWVRATARKSGKFAGLKIGW